jgi:tetratricopeptide (TPR) repeat protein
MRVLAALLVLATFSAPASADDPESRARGHYEIGVGMYRLGDYHGALKEFAAGYELAPKSGFLVNLGQTYRKLNDLEHARAMYQQFLKEAAPDDAKRSQVRALLAELEEALRNPPPPVEPPPGFQNANPPGAVLSNAPGTNPPGAALSNAPGANAPNVIVGARAARPAGRRSLRIAGLTVGAVGVGLVGGGLGFALVADSNARDLNNLDRMGGVFDSAKDSAYGTDRALEAAFFAVGGAAVVTGVVLYVVGRR